MSSSSGDMYEPYKPTDNVDIRTGDIINNPEELKQKRGPFFSCDGSIHEPHFHAVAHHPLMDADGLKFEQLHVPGFDAKDGFTRGTKSDPFHSVTGWHVTISSRNSAPDAHFYQILNTKKYPESTDNDEAFEEWKGTCAHVFGTGDFESKRHEISGMEKAPVFYFFHPHHSEDNDVAGYSIAFQPRMEDNDGVNAAGYTMSLGGDARDSNEAKSKLIDYANSIKNNAHEGMEKKINEAPEYWDDIYKHSKRIFTLGDDGKILDMQDYYPGILRHGSACDCNKCDKWSEIDFKRA